MSGPLIILVSLIYLYVGFEQIFLSHHVGIGLSYLFYAGANFSIYYAIVMESIK